MSFGTRFSLLTVMGTLLLLALCWSSLPVLDEESYWAIAGEIRPTRPYDWQLRWPPYAEQNAFIYAHPPGFLWWIWGLQRLGASLVLTKAVTSVIFGSLMAYVVAQLCLLKSRAPLTSLLCWWGCAAVILPLARGLMPDLPAMALASSALFLWMKYEGWKPNALAGVLLGCAAWIKYPVLLLLFVPIFHAKKTQRWLPFLLGFLTIFTVGELWLWLAYDEVHLWVVLRRASEVASGTFGHRGVGLLVRASLALSSLMVLSLMLPGVLLRVLLGAGVALAVAYELELSGLWLAALLGALGGCVYGPLIRGLRSPDPLLSWTILVVLGVLVTHNYAAPRYLALAVLPWSIWITNQLSDKERWVTAIGILVVLGIGRLEVSSAAAHWGLSQQVLQAFPTGQFSGEWTFRAAMEEGEWTAVKDREIQAPVAISTESAGGRPPTGWISATVITSQPWPVQLVNRDASVGYYAETLGFWPLGLGNRPLARIEIWEP